VFSDLEAKRTKLVRPIFEGLRSSGIETLTGLATALNERGIETPQGRRWHPMTVKWAIEAALMPSFVRCYPKRGQTRVRLVCPLTAISDHPRHGSELTRLCQKEHRSLSRNSDNTDVHGTHVPVEERSTASRANFWFKGRARQYTALLSTGEVANPRRRKISSQK
jgi:hypothetical protein